VSGPPERFPFADQVRAVLFDLGNTLMWIDPARLAATLRGAGLDVAPEAARLAEMRARPRVDPVLAASARLEGNDVRAAVADFVLDELAADVGRRPAARDALVAQWASYWEFVPPDVRPTLDALAARGLRLGVVSNTGDGGARRRLADAGLLVRIDDELEPLEEGIEKPDPRIFERAATRLALPVAGCLFVGDYYSVDVVGARRAGMHAVLLDPADAWGAVDAVRVASLSEIAARLV
jgi:HAD superfamily hydrolase (TIGR01509 family)